jgi:transposase
VLTLPRATRIFIASNPVDMRKSIDGLVAIAKSELAADPHAGHLFVFVSRSNDRVKILSWDRNGFVLYYKRFERGKVKLPLIGSDSMSVEIDATQLSMLLDGIEFRRVPRSRAWGPITPMDKSSTA